MSLPVSRGELNPTTHGLYLLSLFEIPSSIQAGGDVGRAEGVAANVGRKPETRRLIVASTSQQRGKRAWGARIPGGGIRNSNLIAYPSVKGRQEAGPSREIPPRWRCCRPRLLLVHCQNIHVRFGLERANKSNTMLETALNQVVSEYPGIVRTCRTYMQVQRVTFRGK